MSPPGATLMYLYYRTSPGFRITVTLQSGLLEVYSDALSGAALFASQLPSSVMLPTILMVWHHWVTTNSLNVTATGVPTSQQEPAKRVNCLVCA